VTAATEAILNLIYELDERVDLGHFEEAGALFAEGSLSVEGADIVLRGGDEVTAHLHRTLRRHADGSCETVRVTANATVRTHAQTGEAEAYFAVFQATPELPLQPVLGGVYLDTFHRSDHGWAFSSRVVRVRLRGDLSGHVVDSVAR